MPEDLVSIVIYTFLGMIAGAISVFFPGFHSNTISSLISSIGIEPLLAAFCIVGVLAARSAFEPVLSIFFGIPDDTSGLSPLPGQALFLEGRGHEALLICSFSAGAATLMSAILSPAAMALYPPLMALAKPYLAFFICLIVASYAFLQFRSWKALAMSLSVFALAGYCGYAFLNSGTLSDPLFAMFAGMFAPAWLVFSEGSRAKSKAEIVQQVTFPDFSMLKYVAVGVGMSFISLLFPSVSSPIFLASIAAPLFAAMGAEQFLALATSISFSLAVFSFSLAASVGKARIGSIEIASGLVSREPLAIIWLFCAYLVALALSLALFIRVSGRLSKIIIGLERNSSIRYFIAALLVSLVFIQSGFAGVAAFATFFALGCLPFLLGVPRVWLMGCLILPTLFYLMA